jgi:hypothetical protein
MNTSRFSKDTLHANAVLALTKAREKVAKWEGELANPAKQYQVAWIQNQIARAKGRVADLEAALATTEGTEMLRHEEPPATAPGPDWKLVADYPFNIGSKRVNRGQEVDPAELAATANAEALLRWCKWTPRNAPPRKPLNPPAPPVKPVERIDHIRVYAHELDRIMQARGCFLAEAEDVVDRDVFLRAQTQWVDENQTQQPYRRVFDNHLLRGRVFEILGRAA